MALPRMKYPAISRRVERMGVSKMRMCEVTGLSYTGLNDKLEGKTEFTLTEALALARFFGTSVEKLAGKPRKPDRLP